MIPYLKSLLSMSLLLPVFFPLLHGDSVGEFPLPDVIPLPMDAVERLRDIVDSDPEAGALAEELRHEAAPLIGQPATPLEVIHYEGLVNTDFSQRLSDSPEITVRSFRSIPESGWLL